MTTRDNIDTGTNPQGLARVLRTRAEAWRYNADMERAAELSANGEELSATARMSLGYYEDGKRAASAAGREVSAPNPDDNLSAAYRSLSN